MKKKRISLRAKFVCILIVVILLIFFISFEKKLQPMIQSYATNQASNKVMKIINESVYEEIKENGINYSNLVELTYGDTGIVSSLQTNMGALNILQSAITSRIINHLQDFKEQKVRLSLGSIIGGTVFSGRGPFIEIKLIPSNYITTKIANEFTEAGINQTRHRILLDINMTVTTILPGYKFSSKINTNITLAETVIVGAVPEAFTRVGDPTQELVGIIEDYGATTK